MGHFSPNAVKSGGESYPPLPTHPIILKKWNPDVNLLKEDVGNVLVWVKLHGVPVTAFREDGLSAIATKLELKDTIVVECPKNPSLGMGDSEKKNPKKTSQAPKGFQKGVDSTSKVSDSNPFEVLNSVDNDVEMGTNGGTLNLDKNGANSRGSSFWNVKNSSTSTTPVECPGDHDSDDEVASVDNDMARDLASERTRFGTQSLLEQWRDSYGNGDYDEDPYDDDMYEVQDLSKEIQTICDKLDIQVRGRKKQQILISFGLVICLPSLRSSFA
ncbi:retrotransposon protein, putative, ty1-copia subclass [Tanacetum coccineum]